MLHSIHDKTRLSKIRFSTSIRLLRHIHIVQNTIQRRSPDAVNLAFAAMGQFYGRKRTIFYPAAHGGLVYSQPAGHFLHGQ